ncbi:hypothetical protein SUGI_1340840 [Cryptomeria japonica]|uniref:Uncharacterized protein n=1 Tax=Cryptomeria japonica TaxID=3369 RepID=A0AAD3NTB3_CRYJA|nr:hypothetical protein SUGI_0093860 [Cryptomeria japonica]GLJ57533.1 hypothetical protein SUGI_1340630 [Cryptomeria japonica]GLJ57536.1 hypothetical protein SUGI_1340700 [Cryptomeria japonica]GLJ57539.1 hypothetical protein SUGI_1340770 [Cryptomeria japonica]GLJ57542.1 hypothetical protein SUGI_1340840 [Cryptomeria japonica]
MQSQAHTHMNYGTPPPGFTRNFNFPQQQMLCKFPGSLMDFPGPESAFSRALMPTRASQNDYAQHFVNMGVCPQNSIKDPDISVAPDKYPHLKELCNQQKHKIFTTSIFYSDEHLVFLI